MTNAYAVIDPYKFKLFVMRCLFLSFWAAAPIGNEVLYNGEIFRLSIRPFFQFLFKIF